MPANVSALDRQSDAPNTSSADPAEDATTLEIGHYAADLATCADAQFIADHPVGWSNTFSSECFFNVDSDLACAVSEIEVRARSHYKPAW